MDGGSKKKGLSFGDWTDWVGWEKQRRARVELAKVLGEQIAPEDTDEVSGVDAVFICVLDEMHVSVVEAVKGIGGGIHIMCEKPLATTLDDCVRIWRAVEDERKRGLGETVFGICHVLRYSPFNGLLRELVRDKEVIGDVLSVEHTEPVGWWHFSHSYVR